MLKRREKKNLKDLRDFLREEEGLGTVEIILIIVVLIGLVIIFKTQLRSLVEKVFEKITNRISDVIPYIDPVPCIHSDRRGTDQCHPHEIRVRGGYRHEFGTGGVPQGAA